MIESERDEIERIYPRHRNEADSTNFEQRDATRRDAPVFIFQEDIPTG